MRRTWLFDLDNTLHDASRAAFGPTNQAMTDYIATHLAMGQVWFETGDVAKAATAFEQGVKLAPGSPQAHFLLARAYARLGRAADAERERAEFRRLEQLKTGQATGPGAAPPK